MVVYVWVTILVGLFVVGMVYMLFSYVLYSDQVGLENIVNSSTWNNTQAQNTLTNINMAWRMWPLVFIVGLIMWGIVSSQRREPDYGY